jgi:hypothetical protein
MWGVLIASNSKHLTLPIPCPLPGAKSAAQLYEKETSAKKIITFCPGLDSILGGGVSTGQLTEFCRPPTLLPIIVYQSITFTTVTFALSLKNSSLVTIVVHRSMIFTPRSLAHRVLKLQNPAIERAMILVS